MCPIYSTGSFYSTKKSKICPKCRQIRCRCPRQTIPMGNGHVRISFETKGRKGKGATVIRQVPLDTTKLKLLLQTLKQKTSTGGTIKEGAIELQGDQRQAALKLLNEYNFASVKLSGGH